MPLTGDVDAGGASRTSPPPARSCASWTTSCHPLSIGLPVFNGERFLTEAIESILQPTLGDFTLAISDNASTDGTEEIGREFARRGPRVTFVRQPHNGGAAPQPASSVDVV